MATFLVKIFWEIFKMFWETYWALVLGFTISAAIQAVVSKSEMGKLLPNSSFKSLTLAGVLGAASSSCSYAAVAIARSVFRKGADFTAAIVFEFASTNLVIELGILIAILLSWQFTLAEFIGGIIMIALIALFFKNFLKPGLVDEARVQSEKNLQGDMEGHAEMDMSVTEGSFINRLTSEKGITALSHNFVMDWAAIWKDIALGFTLAGILAVIVPHSFWQNFFLTDQPLLAKFWGPLIGPIIAMLTFVCSIGNIPLAAVLWGGGISFGGVVAFIFADLLVLPILNIYRKYYGIKMTIFLFVSSYIAMVLAAIAVEFLFSALGLIPAPAKQVIESGISLNYTAVLNILALGLTILLITRAYKTGVGHMLSMMDKPMKKHEMHMH